MNINHLINKILTRLLLISSLALLNACSPDVGGNEDKTKPSVALTSLNNGEEVIGDFTITWTTDEPNKSTVDIHISYNSGLSFTDGSTPGGNDELEIVALNAKDTGSYTWKTNESETLKDCRTCRISITATDIVGNVGETAISQQDFIINNIPQVFGTALYFDTGNDGFGDPNVMSPDMIIVPFDKDINFLAPFSFKFTVIGDSTGNNANVNFGPRPNEITMTFTDFINSHLHISGKFTPARTHQTAPSGIDIFNGLGAVVTAVDTGRGIEPSGGIDIAPAFSDSGQPLGNNNTRSVVIGDIDNDSDLDFIVAEAVTDSTTGVTNETTRVWINNINNSPGQEGIFTDSGQTMSSNMFGALTLGDIDVDGDLDLIIAETIFNLSTGLTEETTRIWLNNINNSPGQEGIFTDSGQTLIGRNRSLALGDVDNDGDLDLFAVADLDQPRIWFNNINNTPGQEGIFTDSGQPLVGINSNGPIAIDDIDGDGDLDFITTRFTTNPTDGSLDRANHVWNNNINNASGQEGIFTNTGQALGNTNTTSLTLGDIDGDGDIDLITGNSDIATSDVGINLVWINDGAGVFTDSGQKLGSDPTESVVLADIDGDGDLDLIEGIAGFVGQANRVWLNNSSNTPEEKGVFTDSGQTLGNSITQSIALGDLDNDGDIDLIEGNLSSINRVLFNSTKLPGQELFLDSGQTLGENDTRSIALGDVDSDGDLDLVVGNFAEPNRVYLNNINNQQGQEGILTDSGQLLGNEGTATIALGDIDGDGDLDLISGNQDQFNAASDRVWLNNNSNTPGEEGIFTDTGQALGNINTSSVTLGDIDGDGDLDLISDNPEGLLVHKNNGAGSYTDLSQSFNGFRFAALGDIDGDEDLDIITRDINWSVGVLLNNVNSTPGQEGVFIDTGQTLANNNLGVIALIDIDGDSDLDLIYGESIIDPMTGAVSETNRVLINNENNTAGQEGVFTDSGQALGNNIFTTLIRDDIDKDGDIDFVTAESMFTNVNRVWLNNVNNTPGQKGIFTESGQVLGSEETRSIVLGDLDNDGDIDLITGNNRATNRVWLNDF